MVRRWSHLTNINLQASPSFLAFWKTYKKENFKATVNYKRFAFRFSKLKRKALARWKHQTNWLIYSNIIKHWSNDYLNSRLRFRVQALSNVFEKSMLVYNTHLNSSTLVLISVNTKSTFFYMLRHKHFKYYPLYKHYLVSEAFYLEKSKDNSNLVPIVNTSCDSVSSLVEFDELESDVFIVEALLLFWTLSMLVEVRKLLNLCYFFSLKLNVN